MAILNINNEEKFISDECYPLVKFFNDNGMPTKLSWSSSSDGHMCIMFDQTVSNKEIEELLKKHVNERGYSSLVGKFSNWCRPINNQIVYSWMYTTSSLATAYFDYAKLASKA